MPQDVRERLLQNSEHIGCQVRRDLDFFGFDDKPAFNFAAHLEILDQPVDGGGQPEGVQNARAQLRGDSPDGFKRGISESGHQLQLCMKMGLGGIDLPLQPRDVDLQGRYVLPQLIVDLPGDRWRSSSRLCCSWWYKSRILPKWRNSDS